MSHHEALRMLLDAEAVINVAGGAFSCNALYLAADDSNQEAMRLLLSTKRDPNAVGGFHGDSLLAALAGNHRGAVKILLDWKANINDHHSLYTAAPYPNVNVIKLLLHRGATVGERALRKALKRGLDTDVINKLL